MGLLRARVEVGESVRFQTLHSSNTAPQFGHFSALSSTSAPQFVHVNAAALLALSLFAGSADSTLRFGLSFGICRSAPSTRIPVTRAPSMYPPKYSITKYSTDRSTS